MNASSALYTKQYRLAQHYLGRLRSASHAYKSGDENVAYALKLIQQDWPQIQHWQAWSMSQSHHALEAAALCSDYSLEAGDLLDLMLTPEEHRLWRETAMAQAQAQGDQWAEIAHLLALGEIYYKLDEYTESRNYVGQASILARQMDDQRSIAQGLTILGQIARYTGNFAEARAHFEECLEISRRLQDQAGIATSLFGLGRTMQYLGNREAARGFAQESLDIYRRIGDRRGVAHALLGLGASSLTEGYTKIPIQVLEEGLHLFQQMGDRRGTADILGWLSTAYMQDGNDDAALAIGQACIQLYRELDSPGGVTAILGNLAYLWVKRGDFVTARTYYEQSLHSGERIENHWLTGRALHYLGLIAVADEDDAAALSYASRSLALEQQRFEPSALFDAHLLMAIVSLSLNNLPRTRHHLLEAFSFAPLENRADGLRQWMIFAAWLRLRTNQAESSALLLGWIETQRVPGFIIEIVPYGLPRLRAALETALAPDFFAAALEQGRSLDFEATAAEIIAELSR